MEKPTELIIRLTDEQNWHQIDAAFGTGGGVYRLFAAENAQPCAIPRLLEVDLTGTLYIGKANSFLVRVINMKKAILPNYKSTTHDAGVRYKKLTALQEKFPFDQLMVHMTYSEAPFDLERQTLLDYQFKFGEVPPLNAI